MSDATGAAKPLEVFYAYAREDEKLRKKLNKSLSILIADGVIAPWYDRDVSAGLEWEHVIDERLNKANIILLLISLDFIGSPYCYGIEMKRAMERHEAGEARVIPILLRAVDWEKAPFRKLAGLPSNGKPVTSWSNRDEAYADIAKGIRKVAEELRPNPK